MSGEDCSDLNSLALTVLVGGNCADDAAAVAAVVADAEGCAGGDSGLLDVWRWPLVDAGLPPELDTGEVGAGGAFFACACIAASCAKVLPRISLGISPRSTLGILSSVYWRSGMG